MHPTLDRPYTACGYAPMVELIRYLEGNGFTCYIVSGGGRDFMRPITGPLYGIPPERVVGSAVGLVYRTRRVHHRGTGVLRRRADQARSAVEPDRAPADIRGGQLQRRYRDAGIHRRSSHPSLQLLVLHDDADREFDYTAGAEKSLDEAAKAGWTVVSMRDDWVTVFSD